MCAETEEMLIVTQCHRFVHLRLQVTQAGINNALLLHHKKFSLGIVKRKLERLLSYLDNQPACSNGVHEPFEVRVKTFGDFVFHPRPIIRNYRIGAIFI